MEVVYPRCAGLDVHKDMVVACVRQMQDAKINRDVRTFETTTSGLMALLVWLREMACTHVAMEATGVYWKPVWNILSDGDFEMILANAAHIKNVPGRKTDVNDATWIADLLAHGLIRASFVPDRDIQDMRSLLRTRKQLVREQTRHTQRVQKTLEEANIKLDSVITDILGLSGRTMLEAIIAGETEPTKLAALAHRRIKAPQTKLCEALRGRVTDHHRFLLRLHLDQYAALASAIEKIDQQVSASLARMDELTAANQVMASTLIGLLITIPGIGVLAARMILSEIGRDMGRFPTAGHLVSWAGLCPGNDESAGKRRSTRLRKGAPWLKSLHTHEIIAAAVAAGAEAPFVRAADLATDETGSVPVVLDALDRLPGFDLLVLLQPTSPLRTAEDIDHCLETCLERQSPSVVSIAETPKSPYLAFSTGENGRLARLLDPPEGSTRRQDLPRTHYANGAVYVVRVPWFYQNKKFITRETTGCVMPAERSIDIDTLLDFQMVLMNTENGLN
ncbi:MAG: IS110 family transposase [Alphaproteobacteria bacterium]|nr:IS110 family transposase [Alphaproteobacteria bacterium]